MRLSLLLLVAGLPFVLTQTLAADVVVIGQYDTSGINITPDGVLQHHGKTLATILPEGDIRRQRDLVGKISASGAIRLSGRPSVKLGPDGMIHQRGEIVGRISKSGHISRLGVPWGRAHGCYGVVAFDQRQHVLVYLALLTDFLPSSSRSRTESP